MVLMAGTSCHRHGLGDGRGQDLAARRDSVNLSAGILRGPGVSENIEGAIVSTELTQTRPGGN